MVNSMIVPVRNLVLIEFVKIWEGTIQLDKTWSDRGLVIRIGPEVKRFKPGDTVFFNDHSGTRFAYGPLDGQVMYKLLAEDLVLGKEEILGKKQAEA